MLENYLPVLIFLMLATLLAAVLLGLGTFLGRLGARHHGDGTCDKSVAGRSDHRHGAGRSAGDASVPG